MTKKKRELYAILQEYTEWLSKKGYLDDDWWCEEPKAIDWYLDEKFRRNKKTLLNNRSFK